MATTKSNGFSVMLRPHQSHRSKACTANFSIYLPNRRRRSTGGDRPLDKQETRAQDSGLREQILGASLLGWPANRLRWSPRRHSTFLHIWKGQPMRNYIIAGVVILAIGAFVLLQGASFGTKHDILQVGDVKISAQEEQSIPPWVGGAAMLVGVGLIVAGTRKKA